MTWQAFPKESSHQPRDLTYCPTTIGYTSLRTPVTSCHHQLPSTPRSRSGPSLLTPIHHPAPHHPTIPPQHTSAFHLRLPYRTGSFLFPSRPNSLPPCSQIIPSTALVSFMSSSPKAQASATSARSIECDFRITDSRYSRNARTRAPRTLSKGDSRHRMPQPILSEVEPVIEALRGSLVTLNPATELTRSAAGDVASDVSVDIGCDE